jgi:hypothetical protein
MPFLCVDPSRLTPSALKGSAIPTQELEISRREPCVFLALRGAQLVIRVTMDVRPLCCVSPTPRISEETTLCNIGITLRNCC